MVPDIFNIANRAQIIGLAAKGGLPAIYPSALHTRSGGLISYGPDTPDLFHRAASYVDRILKGEKPAELPVQQPTKYELTINLKTAKALGVTIPPTLLAVADESSSSHHRTSVRSRTSSALALGADIDSKGNLLPAVKSAMLHQTWNPCHLPALRIRFLRL